MERIAMTLKLPSYIFQMIERSAAKANISKFSFVMRAFFERFDKTYWVIETDFNNKVKAILATYDYVPEDVQEAIRKATIQLKVHEELELDFLDGGILK